MQQVVQALTTRYQHGKESTLILVEFFIPNQSVEIYNKTGASRVAKLSRDIFDGNNLIVPPYLASIDTKIYAANQITKELELKDIGRFASEEFWRDGIEGVKVVSSKRKFHE